MEPNNEGKSDLEKARCVARALMSLSPQDFSLMFLTDSVWDEYQFNNGPQENKWFKYEGKHGDWFVFKGRFEEESHSQEVLPPGAQVTATFDVRDDEAFLIKFREIVISIFRAVYGKNADLELYNCSWKGKFEVKNGAPKFIFSKSDLSNPIFQVNNLGLAIKSCEPTFNRRVISQFRDDLLKLIGTDPDFPGANVIRIDNPTTLDSFVAFLTYVHDNYCADSTLLGSVQTIASICDYCHRGAQGKPYKNLLPYPVYRYLASVLTSSAETDPTQLLFETTNRAIDIGFSEQLLELVANLRDKVENSIQEALNATTLDDHLDILYRAIPFGYGAFIILKMLNIRKGRFGPKQALFIEGSFKQTEETLNRMFSTPFINQVEDFDGNRSWKRTKIIAENTKRTLGQAAAEKYVKTVVERHMVYPRCYIPVLLS